jgi:citrate lyase subunit gamma (acyl carrier protein)
MKVGIAGSLESNDAMITTQEADSLSIEISSIVDAFFHDQIEKVIRDTLKERNIDKVKVICQDKGALDYTIKARLITALERMEK